MVDVSETKEVQKLVATLASLRLCATNIEDRTAALDALDQADL